MDQPIDLRSDTVTRPTDAMRHAMARAQVGDDVMRADPTVIALEEHVAKLFDKPAALFTPSGTMANLLAILSQTRPGDEILTHRESHIYYYEGGGYAAVAGCSVRFVDDSDAPKPGVMTPAALEHAMRGVDVHFPTPALLTLENTHNRGGGVVWPIDAPAAIARYAHDRGLRVHTDGARIWNASIATGQSLSALAEHSDTLSACLSKGLGCPVGSVLMGDVETIKLARRKRKMLGGGMRQAGVLAAAGLYAIDHHIERLGEDHRRAKSLAIELARLLIFDFEPERVETNLVYAKMSDRALRDRGDAIAWQKLLKASGVLCYAESPTTLRFVTHLDLTDEMIAQTLTRIAALS